MPKGRLTKKIQRQDQLSTMTPPRSGPRTVAAPKVPPKNPAYHGLGPDHQPPAAQSLERAKQDQHDHAVRDATEHAADEKDDDRRLEVDLATVQVTELAPQGRAHR
jgi:hypothetical protein